MSVKAAPASATITQVRGYVTNAGDLQVTVKTSGDAEAYRLYRKASGDPEYSLVCETDTPVLRTTYSADYEYAVSIVDGVESAPVKVSPITKAVVSENVFQGKTFVQDSDARASDLDGYEYYKLTDGIIYPADYRVGRYSSDTNTAAADATPTKIAAATIDLDGEYILNELRFCIFNRDRNNIGTNFTVEVFADGEWVTVYNSLAFDVLNTSAYIKYIANPEDGTGKSTDWLTFDLGGIKASKLRFHSDPLSGKGVSFYEAECDGTLVETNLVNVLSGKEIVGSEPVISSLYTYDKLNDGIMSNLYKIGRYVSRTDGRMDATVDLEDRYALSELRLYMYNNTIAEVGENWQIDAYLDGDWTTVKTIATNAALEDLIVSLDGDSLEDRFVSIDLDGVVAEKLRFRATALSSDVVCLEEIRCLGVLDDVNEEDGNAFEGKTFIGATATDISGSYTFTYDKLTDGVLSTDWKYGRFSSSEGFDGTIDLQGVYRLNTLKVYSYLLNNSNMLPAGQNWAIQVYLNGSWKTVKTIATNEDLASLVVTRAGGTLEDKWIAIDLGGVFAEKVRLTADMATTYISINEIRCTGIPVKYEYAEQNGNVLDGYAFVGSEPVAGAVYGYEKLTDGIVSTETTNGRYSSQGGGSFGGSLDFGGSVYLLDKMKFYLFRGQDQYAGENWTFEVYLNGAWKTVKTIATHEAFIALEETTGGSGPEDLWIEVDLGGVAAEKIRLSAVSYNAQGITFTEIRCTGYEVIDVAVDRSDMIDAYENVTALQVSGDDHETALALFRGYLTDTHLTAANATLYTEAMDTYYNGYSHYVLTLSDAGVTTDMGNPIKGYALPAGNAWVSPNGTVYAGGAAIPDLTEDTTYYALKATLLDGASIRLNNPTGLRFTATADEGLIDVLNDNAVDFTVGILIYPTDQLVGSLTRATEGAIDLSSDLAGIDPADGVYTMHASITNILAQNYARAFSARAYIKVGETVIYTDYTAGNNSRSVYEVAKAAYEDRPAGVSPYSEGQLAVIRSFIDSVVEITDISAGNAVTQYSATYYVPNRTVTYDGAVLTMSEGGSVKSVLLGGKIYTSGWTVTDGTLTANYVKE